MPTKRMTKQKLQESLDRLGIAYSATERVADLREKLTLYEIQRGAEKLARLMGNNNPVSILPNGFFR